MPTPLELKLIHLAVRQAGLEEEHYRMILRNVAGVASAKDLTQTDFENVMATLEDSGFRHAGKPEDYWRSKVAMRGLVCGERMVRKIEELAAQQKYDLAGLCRRFSGDRVARVDKLRPREGLDLIEALKAIIQREAAKDGGIQTSFHKGTGPHCPQGGAETHLSGFRPGAAIQAGGGDGIGAAQAAGGLPVGRVEAGTACDGSTKLASV